MSIISGECFIAINSNTENKSVIFGRNSSGNGEDLHQEVHYYDASESLADIPSDDIDISSGKNAIILQKPGTALWGGDFGANEKNVCIGISWSDGEEAETLKPTDIIRIALAKADTTLEAVDLISSLVTAHVTADSTKISFVICDPNEAYFISTGGKTWAGQRISEGLIRAPSDGLAVTTTIDKSSSNLNDTLKTLGLWDGEGDLNFATCLGANSNQTYGIENKSVDNIICMFELLRSTANDKTRSATVSILNVTGISCHWFTATPNPCESVFKPFVFAPNPKISPLTKIMPNGNITLLHKLHAQRKPEAIQDLKNLESKCVEEVNKHLQENPTPSEELDELMKDCVEAEVKFYR